MRQRKGWRTAATSAGRAAATRSACTRIGGAGNQSLSRRCPAPRPAGDAARTWIGGPVSLDGDAAADNIAAGKSTATGGGSGIRTHGELAPTPVFKTGALNRSAIPPEWRATRNAPSPPKSRGVARVAPLGCFGGPVNASGGPRPVGDAATAARTANAANVLCKHSISHAVAILRQQIHRGLSLF